MLDSIDAALLYAETMTWKGQHPVVKLVTTTYQTGIKLSKEAMAAIEAQIERLPQLGKWFLDIDGSPLALRDT